MPRLTNDLHGRLAGSDAVAGLILLGDGRYVLQQPPPEVAFKDTESF